MLVDTDGVYIESRGMLLCRRMKRKAFPSETGNNERTDRGEKQGTDTPERAGTIQQMKLL